MEFDEISLAGKVALVTGAGSNLPAVIAEELASFGATVALNDLELNEALQNVVKKIRAHSGRGFAFPGDVSKKVDIEDVIEKVTGKVGVIDILVNGVGPYAGGPFLELSERDWDFVIDTNLKATFLLTQLVAPMMKQKGWGRIINFSAGSADYRGASVYGLAKNAIRYLTQSLALELGPEITVNDISPGQILESLPEVAEIDPAIPELAEKHTPTGKLVTRREIAKMAVLLCSPYFDSVTGQTVRMDGGWSIPRWLSN